MDRDRRFALGLFAVLAVALVVRLLWLPDWDRVLPPVDGRWPPGGAFDGHERGYVRAFLGQAPDPSTQAWPLLTGLYGLLGRLTGDVRALVVLSGLAGASTALAAALWTARRFSRAAGLWAGLLVALLPEHAAWSTSAYNVALPTTLLAWAFVARSRHVQALLVVLAVSMRGELALLSPFVGWAGLVGPPVAAAWFHHLGAPEAGDPLLALRLNLPMVRYLGPPVLLVGLLALRDREAWPVAGFALWVHLSAAPFFDLGFRHELLGGLAACVLCGVAAARLRHLPGVVVAAGLLWGSRDLAARWNASPGFEPAEIVTAGTPDPACVEVTDEPPIAGQPLQSHVGLWTGEVDPSCVLWGEAAIHRAWTSRALHDRALRMRTLYRLTPVAVRQTPGGPILLHRVERRW